MKNVLINPLKVIVAGMFVVAMAFGMSTSLKVSEPNGNINLLALSNIAVAQGESGGNTTIKCKCKKPLFGAWRCVSNGTRGTLQ